MSETVEQTISRLEDDVARLRFERDRATAVAGWAKQHLLGGADEETLPGKFWANEIRHAFSALPDEALARLLGAEVERIGVDIAYDELFFSTDGDTSTGMRRAVKIINERSVELTASGAVTPARR